MKNKSVETGIGIASAVTLVLVVVLLTLNTDDNYLFGPALDIYAVYAFAGLILVLVLAALVQTTRYGFRRYRESTNQGD